MKATLRIPDPIPDESDDTYPEKWFVDHLFTCARHVLDTHKGLDARMWVMAEFGHVLVPMMAALLGEHSDIDLPCPNHSATSWHPGPYTMAWPRRRPIVVCSVSP